MGGPPGRGGSGWDVKAVVAATKHDGGDSRHNGLRLDVEVASHFIGMPAARPIRRMRSEPIPPHNMAMAPPGRVERAEISLVEKSESDGGSRRTARRRKEVTSAGRINCHGAVS